MYIAHRLMKFLKTDIVIFFLLCTIPFKIYIYVYNVFHVTSKKNWLFLCRHEIIHYYLYFWKDYYESVMSTVRDFLNEPLTAAHAVDES